MNVSFGRISAQALRGGASTMALGLALIGLAPAAHAQDQDAQAEEGTTQVSASTDPSAAGNPDDASDSDIIVTGQRRALQTSATIKRNADTVVDSITATDIGAFPDKSVRSEE